MKKLSREFYERDTLTVARELLGKYLVRKIGDKELICKLTEVEAYIGPIDKASHAYNGRLTDRTRIMFEEAGYAYIYLIYGMYYCLNFVTEPVGRACAVLIRAVEPVSGIEEMSRLRYDKDYKDLTTYQKKNFLNGPGKLCNALGIDKELNGTDLLGDELYVIEPEVDEPIEILTGKRINIDYAEEAIDFPWRFYIK